MRTKLLKYWDRIRSSFWFVPTVMAAGAALLAFATVALDEAIGDDWLDEVGWAYTGGAEGAASVLGTIAGSMITIAGVVFSLTLVALSIASSQFGPRLLRNFMRDTINQFVLGIFIATFLYCLLVLRTIRRGDEIAFVPHVSVTIGVLFAILSLGVLIYFIHHVSLSIQADEIVARVGRELKAEVDRFFPDDVGRDAAQSETPLADVQLPEAFDREARSIVSTDDGYLQLIDGAGLLDLAVESDAVLRIERRPGHYVICGSPLVSAWPPGRADDAFAARVNAAFALGNQRTPGQDVEFAVHQLVEIALRALSPGINDPFTAMTCVDRLGSALCRVAQRRTPSTHRLDDAGRLRVVAPQVTFRGIADAALNQIRQHARSNAAVAIRLLETLAGVAAFAVRQDDRDAIARHAEMVERAAQDGLPEAEDRKAVHRRYEEAMKALKKSAAAAALPT